MNEQSLRTFFRRISAKLALLLGGAVAFSNSPSLNASPSVPMFPDGFAVKSNHRTGYEMDAFLEFYRTGLNHIIDLNCKGYSLTEIYTKILLHKILMPEGTGYVDLQSPSGAGLNVLVYNYDGDVYATDEARMLAEMQDHTFKLGNVLKHSRAQIFTSPAFVNLLQCPASAGNGESVPPLPESPTPQNQRVHLPLM